MTRPITHGISMNPITKVTEPQSMSASEAPRRSEAKPAGDIRGGGRRLSAGGASAGRRAGWGGCRRPARREQSSWMSRDSWSSVGIVAGTVKEGTLTLIPMQIEEEDEEAEGRKEGRKEASGGRISNGEDSIGIARFINKKWKWRKKTSGRFDWEQCLFQKNKNNNNNIFIIKYYSLFKKL